MPVTPKRFATLGRGALFAAALASLCQLALAQQPPPGPQPPSDETPGLHETAEMPVEDYGGPFDMHADGIVDPVVAMAQIRRRALGVDEDGYLYPSWYAQADAMFLDRSRSREARLVEDQNGAGPLGQRPTLLTTEDLDYDTAWGPRISLGCRLDDCRRCEIVYFGLHHWMVEESLQSTSTPFNLSIPFQASIDSDFDGVEFLRASSSSDLHSLELNCFVEDWRSCCCVTPFVGFRYFNFHDELSLHPIEADGQGGLYDVDADNNLIGYQVGGAVDRVLSERFSWNVQGKVGAYLNLTRQSTLLVATQTDTVYRDFTDHDEDFAFLGEVSVNLVYQLTRYVSLTAGYQVMWLDGVALAPEQLDYTVGPTSGSRVDHDGDVFFNGGYIGIRITN